MKLYSWVFRKLLDAVRFGFELHEFRGHETAYWNWYRVVPRGVAIKFYFWKGALAFFVLYGGKE